jgi:hypothetical protein
MCRLVAMFVLAAVAVGVGGQAGRTIRGEYVGFSTATTLAAGRTPAASGADMDGGSIASPHLDGQPAWRAVRRTNGDAVNRWCPRPYWRIRDGLDGSLSLFSNLSYSGHAFSALALDVDALNFSGAGLRPENDVGGWHLEAEATFRWIFQPVRTLTLGQGALLGFFDPDSIVATTAEGVFRVIRGGVYPVIDATRDIPHVLSIAPAYNGSVETLCLMAENSATVCDRRVETGEPPLYRTASDPVGPAFRIRGLFEPSGALGTGAPVTVTWTLTDAVSGHLYHTAVESSVAWTSGRLPTLAFGHGQSSSVWSDVTYRVWADHDLPFLPSPPTPPPSPPATTTATASPTAPDAEATPEPVPPPVAEPTPEQIIIPPPLFEAMRAETKAPGAGGDDDGSYLRNLGLIVAAVLIALGGLVVCFLLVLRQRRLRQRDADDKREEDTDGARSSTFGTSTPTSSGSSVLPQSNSRTSLLPERGSGIGGGGSATSAHAANMLAKIQTAAVYDRIESPLAAGGNTYDLAIMPPGNGGPGSHVDYDQVDSRLAISMTSQKRRTAGGPGRSAYDTFNAPL